VVLLVLPALKGNKVSLDPKAHRVLLPVVSVVQSALPVRWANKVLLGPGGLWGTLREARWVRPDGLDL
jgi:hypothetical protein